MKLLEAEIGISLLGKAKNISLAFVVMIIAHIVSYAFLSMFFPGMPVISEHDHVEITARGILFVCVVTPLWEELVFRHLPLKLISTQQDSTTSILPVVLASSVIFGLLHGGLPNLFFQGIGGFLMATVYIRNGFHYWSSVVLHSMWNMFCFLYS